MDISQKMKKDWDRRALLNARFWVDTNHFQNDAVFDQAGASDVERFLMLLNDDRKPSWTVLEIGCGIGRMIKPMARFFLNVAGVDVSGQMIAQGRERLKDLANVRLFENNGLDLKTFEPDQFDLVYSCIAFQHMPEEVFEHYLNEINRILRPQGFLEFQAYIGAHREILFEDTLTVRVYEENELLAKLTRHGFMLKNRQAEPSQTQGPSSSIWVFQKSRSEPRAANAPRLQKECPDQPSPLENQLTLQLAKNHIRDKDATAAERLLRCLIETNPPYLEAWFELTILLLDKGRSAEGIATLEKMLAKNPAFFGGYYSLAELYQKNRTKRKSKKHREPSTRTADRNQSYFRCR